LDLSHALGESINFRRFLRKVFFAFSCQENFSLCIKGTLHGRSVSRRMHEPFLTETFALSKKKIKQAGRLDHGSGAAHVALVRRASQD
jgi:hypothetical protein